MSSQEDKEIEKKVWEKLKEIQDPEFDIDIVSLGLIYEVKVKNKNVEITMTLTTPACPLGDIIFDEIKKKMDEIEGIENVYVDLTFDPPWNFERMSDEAKEKLGLL